MRNHPVRPVPHRPNRAGPPPADCPLEDALRFLAGAWTHQILWYLRAEPRRFGELKRDLGTISAKVLTARLRDLEARGVISRTVRPTSPPTVEYATTPLGLRLAPVLKAVADVGRDLRRHPEPARVPARPAGRSAQPVRRVVEDDQRR